MPFTLWSIENGHFFEKLWLFQCSKLWNQCHFNAIVSSMSIWFSFECKPITPMPTVQQPHAHANGWLFDWIVGFTFWCFFEQTPKVISHRWEITLFAHKNDCWILYHQSNNDASVCLSVSQWQMQQYSSVEGPQPGCTKITHRKTSI